MAAIPTNTPAVPMRKRIAMGEKLNGQSLGGKAPAPTPKQPSKNSA